MALKNGIASVLLASLLTRGDASNINTKRAATTYNWSPTSRTIKPLSIYRTTGSVSNISPNGNKKGSATDVYQLSGPHASITYDFGQQIAGAPSLSFVDAVCGGVACTASLGLPGFSCDAPLCQGLGVAYSESAAYAGVTSDNSVNIGQEDGTLYIPITKGTYTVPDAYARGGYRYLTFSLNNATAATTKVSISLSSVHFNAEPNLADNSLGKYTGYFQSDDDILNKIWYAGAYTLQMNLIPANSSVQRTHVVTGGWSNDATCSGLSGSDILLSDGAKRDRSPWAGDLSVSMRSAYVSHDFADSLPARNVLQEVIILQDKTPLSKTYGYFPYVGSPLGELFGLIGQEYSSDTYHLWLIESFADYVLITNDTTWANQYWSQIILGVQTTYNSVDSMTGLYSATLTSDWGRIGLSGQSTSLNALYYHTLLRLVEIAPRMNAISGVDTAKWTSMAAKIKTSANSLLWDASAGLYYDNTTTAGHQLHPQDANAFAVNYNLTDSASKNLAISNALAARLTKYGTPAPELPGSISPFISSHELRTHFLAKPGNSTSAMNLLRNTWSYMLQAFSNSTFIEGYATNGALSYGFYGNDYSFISHTHAWGTGPVHSLLNFLVGIQASAIDVAPGDGSWAFMPHVDGSDVSQVDGGFTTKAGTFSAQWTLSNGRFIANVSTPSNVMGTIYVPGFGGKAINVVVDGARMKIKPTNDFYRFGNVKGGKHTVVVLVGK